MRNLVVCKRTVKLSRTKKLTLIYSVTIDELAEASLAAGLESYGASITVKETGERAVVRHITLRSSEILSLTELLSSNFVTPLTLFDVVYDWLCRD